MAELCLVVKSWLSLIYIGAVLTGCSPSVRQQFSNDTTTHPIADLSHADLSPAKQIIVRELAEPKHYVAFDIDLPWIAAHPKARDALRKDGYVEMAGNTPAFTGKARAEAKHCGRAGDGSYLCRFVIAREVIVSFDQYRRVPTSIIGYEGTSFDVTVRSMPVSRIGNTLLKSGTLTCLAVAPKSASIPWRRADQLAFDSFSLPTPLQAEREYDLTVFGCPSLDDPKEL